MEAKEVFYKEAHADGSAAEPVMLGDVLFVDADGNETIQRTTAVEDGTIQQQYLGQAEYISLFLLDDIVAAGLRPYSQSVENVYDVETIDEGAEAQVVLEDDYDGHIPGVREYDHHNDHHPGVLGPSYSRVDQLEFRNGNQAEVEAYEETLMHTYDAADRQNVQQRYGGDIVIDGTMYSVSVKQAA